MQIQLITSLPCYIEFHFKFFFLGQLNFNWLFGISFLNEIYGKNRISNELS